MSPFRTLAAFSVLFAASCSATPVGFEEAVVVHQEKDLVVNNDVSYGNAVDIAGMTSSNMLTCLKKAKYQVVFVRGFNPAGAGSFDANAADTIRYAYSAGLGIEVYMTPQPASSILAYQQMDMLYNGLTSNGITVRSVWIQVTSPANWNKNSIANVDFISNLIARGKQYGLTVGIYTNQYDWSQITGNWNTLSSDVLLWYWNVLGPGTSGETKNTFADFRAFGSFTKASVKQYGQAESVCQMILNRDVYAVGIPAAASVEEKMVKEKIVVGGFVGH